MVFRYSTDSRHSRASRHSSATKPTKPGRHTRRGRPNSVRRPIRGLAVPSIPSIRTIRNTIMATSCGKAQEQKQLVGLSVRGPVGVYSSSCTVHPRCTICFSQS